MSKFDILLYNKVQLEDGAQGIIRYMGCIMGKKGVFYGVDITKGDAKNDGTFKSIKYFDTKKGTKTGRFVKENKITKCKKTTFSKFPFKMGQTVMCTKTKCKGIIRYIGVPSWAKGGKVYYGLELNKRKGTTNGTTQGIQYFECKTKYGIYVRTKEVEKVADKNAKNDDEKEEKDVREHIKGYYRSKSGNNLLPKSLKVKKNKAKKKKPKKVKKAPPTEPSYLQSKRRGSLEVEPALTPQPPMPEQPRGSVDYGDEEKDGIDLEAYTAKTEQMDFENAGKQRREQIEIMKQMEREDKRKREEAKRVTMLKEHEEEQRKNKELMYREDEERKQELAKRTKELKDKERLEKYAQAMKDREEADKQREELERVKKENEMTKQKEMEAKRGKEEQERKDREQQRQMAEKLRKEKEQEQQRQMADKLRKEKEAKMKEEEEEKKSQNVISNGSAGSIKDRMAMFQKQTNNAPKQKPNIVKTAPKFGVKSNNAQKQQYTSPKSTGVGAPVGADKAINFAMTEAFGKPLKSIKMTKIPGYKGEIPLVLYLLGQKLVKLDKFGTVGIFHPEKMEQQKDKQEMQIAHNIFTFFADLPSPLLHSVPQSVLDKALSKDVMKDVIDLIDEPPASILCYLWDLLAKVAMNPNARMGQQSLGKVFGPMCTLVTQQDVKGNRVSMNALAASRMMAFFRRGVEWRMEIQGFNFEDSDDSD